MSRRFLVSALLAFTIMLLITGGIVWAAIMSSTNYEMDKLTLEGSGGNMASANYNVGFTVGQTVIGATSSTNYQAKLGFWPGTQTIERDEEVYLPIMVKND